MAKASLILKTGATVGDPFAIEGIAQIVVQVPDGETWGTRTVTLQYQSPFEDESGWRDVSTEGEKTEWTEEGFEEVRGSSGIIYRLSATSDGCQAKLFPVKTYVTSRPGR